MNKNTIIISLCLLVFFGLVMRFLPHPPNMTPLTAIALVGGWYIGRRWAIALPVVTLLLSDIAIGLYDWKIMLSVYGSFVLIGVLSYIVSTYRSVFSAGVVALSSSVLFFVITNAAVWAFSPWYAKTVAGLLYAYELGLPFLKNMLMGDVLYTAVLVVLCESVVLLGTPMRSFRERTSVVV